MHVTVYKTPKIQPNDDIYKILDTCLPSLQENSVVVVTSKIVGLCEGNVVKDDGSVTKEDLVPKEADWYVGDEYPAPYGTISIKNNILCLNAGIDESNVAGYFALWPKDPYASAQTIWEYVRKKHKVQHLGVVISDSHIVPLRWGVRGVCLAYCGFNGLNVYIGKPDIFGKPLKSTRAGILDGLASAAVMVMGEGNEQTPLAVITDVPFVQFTGHPPTKKELQNMEITRKDDIYGSLLEAVRWKKGGSGAC